MVADTGVSERSGARAEGGRPPAASASGRVSSVQVRSEGRWVVRVAACRWRRSASSARRRAPQDGPLDRGGGSVEVGTQIHRYGIRHRRMEELATGAVDPAQRTPPHEHARLGLLDLPPALVLDLVIVAAHRTQVDPHRGPAAAVLAGVVLLTSTGPAPAPRERAGAVPDLGMATQRGGREPITGPGVEVDQVILATGVLLGDVGNDSGPVRPDLRPPARR